MFIPFLENFLMDSAGFYTGIQKQSMKLILEGVAVELDAEGHVRSRLNDCAGVALRLDGAEMDGVKFSVSVSGSGKNSMEIVMEGEGLSDEIRPNYPVQAHSPARQVSFKSQEARFTANTLNKLMRRTNKEMKGTALLIRDVRELAE
jgi:2,3-bisphosphoglycerate-independent phosphoglycerate mutase